MSMEVFNVLCKGVENKINPFCKAFLKEEDAREWCQAVAERRGWTIMSSFGWNDDMTMDDYRCEDAEGNSYYFVIYRQQL